jgi:chromosome segregation and condensation protein ScpB
MERPLRLISSNPVDQLARTVEALLVVASQPLGVDELCAATGDDADRGERRGLRERDLAAFAELEERQERDRLLHP